eukprot:TRINITY_DN4929_c0_g3_i1.p1 TRINITY_DN4929_c0_g3~~TRINITY_DN4929_c0_g3_i1.p1  ORF type:complete len:371 (+),score=60.44 TRINITY_DN4929_c0_g3_i1:128-1240(+)
MRKRAFAAVSDDKEGNCYSSSISNSSNSNNNNNNSSSGSSELSNGSDEAKYAVLGRCTFKLGSARLGHLRTSDDLIPQLYDDFGAAATAVMARRRLHSRLAADGYLFFRNLLPEDAVSAARLALMKRFQAIGLLEEDSSLEDGRVSSSQQDFASPDVGSTEEVLDLLNNPQLFHFLDTFFAQPVETVFEPNFRAVRPGQSSGFHTDSVYMGSLMAKGLPQIVACWIPLMDVSTRLGGLVVCRSSNSNPGFQKVRETYGHLDMDESDIGGTGWFTEDPEEVIRYGGRWETEEYRPGDVVLFTMHTFHGSSVNCSNRWRLSLDFRVRPTEMAAKEPISLKKGRWSRLRHDPREFPRTMTEAKAEWGLLQEKM